MAGHWEAKTGLCYRNRGILCAEGTCGHCDGARATVNKDERIAQLEFEAAYDRFLKHSELLELLNQTKEEN